MHPYLERFVAAANNNGSHLAIDAPNEKTTYSEFLHLAKQYASAFYLRKSAERVLIQLDQCSDAYAAMFGAGLVGKIYTPINTSQPLEKRRAIAKIFNPDIVVSDRLTAIELGYEDENIIKPEDLTNSVDNFTPSQQKLAYVIFTSGSTGTPKGVAISRDALNHYVDWIGEDIVPTPADRWSQHPNLGFDLSVLDIYGALCFGATLVPLVTPLDRLMPGQAIKKYKLTIWDSVPSVIDLMIKANQLTAQTISSLRLATFCGEPLRREHLVSLFNAHPNLLIHNTYGPTEATVSCTIRKISKFDMETVCDTSVALGDPIPGMSITLNGGPDETEGEIVLSGPQLAEGYWGDKKQTQIKYKAATAGTRLYHTGDWAKFKFGELYFAERIDNQIKIKGHRLDLAEVDAALGKCGIIAACCVFYDKKIHAFIELHGDRIETSDSLRKKLKRYLEPHAIPETYYFVDVLPLNENDKVNRHELRQRLKQITNEYSY